MERMVFFLWKEGMILYNGGMKASVEHIYISDEVLLCVYVIVVERRVACNRPRGESRNNGYFIDMTCSAETLYLRETFNIFYTEIVKTFLPTASPYSRAPLTTTPATSRIVFSGISRQNLSCIAPPSSSPTAPSAPPPPPQTARLPDSTSPRKSRSMPASQTCNSDTSPSRIRGHAESPSHFHRRSAKSAAQGAR